MAMTVTTAQPMDPKDYIGMDFYAAIDAIHVAGLKPRVVKLDGVPQPMDSSICMDRVNLEVSSNKITNAVMG